MTGPDDGARVTRNPCQDATVGVSVCQFAVFSDNLHQFSSICAKTRQHASRKPSLPSLHLFKETTIKQSNNQTIKQSNTNIKILVGPPRRVACLSQKVSSEDVRPTIVWGELGGGPMDEKKASSWDGPPKQLHQSCFGGKFGQVKNQKVTYGGGAVGDLPSRYEA